MTKYSILTDKEIAKKSKAIVTAGLSRSYSLPAIAAECGVTPYTPKRIFKAINGSSIAEFTLKIRMEGRNYTRLTE